MALALTPGAWIRQAAAPMTDSRTDPPPTPEAPGAPSAPTEVERPTAPFESLMDRLGEIVRELEQGDLPLERALELFEEGVRLCRHGAERLDRAEARIDELLGKELRSIEARDLVRGGEARAPRGA